MRRERAQPGVGEVGQLVVARRAGGAHGAEDAASLARQFLIRDAGVAQLELLGAVAREDEMRVRIHEARQDGAPARVHDSAAPLKVNLSRQRVLRPDPDDAPVPRRHRPALDHAQRPRASAGFERDEPADVGERPVGGKAVSLMSVAFVGTTYLRLLRA